MAYTFKVTIANPCTSSNTPLSQGATILDNQQVNPAWFEAKNLRWNKKKLHLPDDPQGTLFTPRGQDIPKFPSIKRVGTTPWTTSKAAGSLVFVQGNEQKLFGGSDATIQEGQIRFSVELDTQLPCLSFTYQREVEKSRLLCYRVILHGNTAMKDAMYCSPTSIKSGSADLPIPPKHQKAAQEGRLVGSAIQFGQSNYHQRHCNCVRVLHGSTEGNTFDRWSSDDDMFHDMFSTMRNNGYQHTFDAAIRDTFFGQDMRMIFLREIEPVDTNCMERIDPEYKHWEHVMNISIKFEPFWFYRMQPGFFNRLTISPRTSFNVWNTPDNPPPVPFWLVRKFKAMVEGKRLTKLIPLEWASLARERTPGEASVWIFPNVVVGALLEELSIKREMAWERAVEKELFSNERQHRITLRWLGVMGGQVFFRVDIAVCTLAEDSTESKLVDKVLPQPGSSITVIPRVGMKREMDATNVKLQGRVIDEMPIKGASQLVALCNGRHEDSELLNSFFKNHQIATHASVTVRSNLMAIEHMTVAFTGVFEDYRIPISAQHILLGFSPSPGDELADYRFLNPPLFKLSNVDSAISDYARRHLGGTPGFKELCSWFGFNLKKSELNAILSFIRNGEGKMTAINGIPGTGKSRTLACLAVVLHFVFGSKCAITAPSNSSCKAIMDKLLTVYRTTLEPRGMRWNLIRLSTSGATPVVGHVIFESLEATPIINTGLHELALHQRGLWTSELRFGDHSFHQAKRRFAVDASSDPTLTDELINASVDWLEILKGAATGDVAAADMARIIKADDLIGRQVLSTRCDLLVGTFNSMGSRSAITSACHIDTLIVDDGDQATVPELCIPFHAFRKTLVRAIIGGDVKQNEPVLASHNANETVPFLPKPLFRELCQAKDKDRVHRLS